MPKKIKKQKETKLKNSDEKLIRADNIHYFAIGAVVLLVIICAIVGGSVYSNDKYHAHSSVAFTSFVYTEKVDEGYNIYEVNFDESDNTVYTYFTTPDSTIQKKWSNNKYLDFNEELYLGGILSDDDIVEVVTDESEVSWSLEITLVTGEEVYYSSNYEQGIDKATLAELIEKYFNSQIIYQ